jgi:putative FmdB family regulatory protein
MPIYEYECEKCCFRFELLKKVGENAVVYCPRCHGQSRRIFSSVPAIFKGSRWVGERSQKQDSQAEIKADKKPKANKKTGITSKEKNTD